MKHLRTQKFFQLSFLNIVLALFVISPVNTFAQSVMTSSGYKIQSDSVNFAGALSSSTNYMVEDTLGEDVSSRTDSSTYRAYLGYQFMEFAAPDTTDPSAPSSLTAQVISSSEIELSWSESTDNIGVVRYYIYRDGVRIDDVATFPRDFNDTGLSANTAYSYNVSAVDDSQNESLWSATTTATTLGGSTEGSQSGSRNVVISNLSISSNDDNAYLSFDTSVPSSVEINWSSISAPGGTLSGPFTFNHSFLLQNLVPSTPYTLNIVLKDGNGNIIKTDTLSFRTLSVALSQAPANVSNFLAKPTEDAIDLSWILPKDNRIVGVRLVRSTEAYPSSPDDGEVIFEHGDATKIETFSDNKVEKGITYYYAIFTKDLAENLSSGALTHAKILLPGQIPEENPLDKLLPAGNVDPKIEKLQVKDFLFIQSGDSVPIEGGLVTIRGDKNTTVALRYYKVPPVLKTIAVSIITREENPERFTFILRPNRDKTRYEATIGSLGEPRSYTLRINIIDFKNQGLKTLKGTLEISDSVSKPVMPVIDLRWLIAALILLILVIFFVYIARRKKLEAPLIDTHAPYLEGQ